MIKVKESDIKIWRDSCSLSWNIPEPFPTMLEVKAVMTSLERITYKPVLSKTLPYIYYKEYMSREVFCNLLTRVLAVRHSIVVPFRYKLAAAQAILDNATDRARKIINTANEAQQALEEKISAFRKEQHLAIYTWGKHWEIWGNGKYLVVPLAIHMSTIEYGGSIVAIPRQFDWSTDYLIHVLDDDGTYDLASSFCRRSHPHSGYNTPHALKTCLKFATALPRDVKDPNNLDTLVCMLQNALGGVNYDSLLIARKFWDQDIKRRIPHPLRTKINLNWHPTETIVSVTNH